MVLLLAHDSVELGGNVEEGLGADSWAEGSHLGLEPVLEISHSFSEVDGSSCSHSVSSDRNSGALKKSELVVGLSDQL